jgi:hypothetical protein
MHRGYPDFRNHVGGQKFRQDESITLVGLGASFSDLLDPDGVGDFALSNKWSQ